MAWKQDIRLVQLQNLRRRRGDNEGDMDRKGLPSFTYFDKITVSPVPEVEGADAFQAAYDGMQKSLHLENQEELCSQQLLMAFTPIRSKTHKKKIEDFWKDYEQSALFFMTMVNIVPWADLDEMEKNIKKIFQRDTLIYYTLEYNAILIFAKRQSFHEYSRQVMLLNYGGDAPGILDTITLYALGAAAASVEGKPFSAYFRFGTSDYQGVLDALKEKPFQSNIENRLLWLLGRNDLAFWFPELLLKDLYSIIQQIQGKNLPISTCDLLLLLPQSPNTKLLGTSALKTMEQIRANPEASRKLNCICAEVWGWTQNLEEAYKNFCQKKGMSPDGVFLRILNHSSAMICDIQKIQLAKDLEVCLYLQFQNFTRYMTYALKELSEEEHLQKDTVPVLLQCLNTFYLNITELINSTVHSDRRFIQIPHYGVPAFEMPPKIMAYYNIMAHKIAEVLCEDGAAQKYGIMLSPKLVDDLEVESVAFQGLPEPNELFSVSISEKMMYDPQRTVAILGHETAHFVGETLRQRKLRANMIYGYYMSQFLNTTFEWYLKRLGGSADEDVCDYFFSDKVLDFCEEKTKDFPIASSKEKIPQDEEHKLYLRILPQYLVELPRWVFCQHENCQAILETFIAPKGVSPQETQIPLYLRSLLQDSWLQTRLSKSALRDLERSKTEKTYQGRRFFLEKVWNGLSQLDKKQVLVHANQCFLETLSQCTNHWRVKRETRDFHTVVGYLFSESYADLCMVLIFGLDPQSYIQLFTKSEVRNDTEILRLISVARVMLDLERWMPVKRRVSSKMERGSWEQRVWEALEMTLNAKRERLGRFCAEQRYNLMLLAFLTKYLLSCAEQLKAFWAARPEYQKKIKELQILYDEVQPGISIKRSISRIAQLELEYCPLLKITQEQEK